MKFRLLAWAYMNPAVQIGCHRTARVLDADPSKAVVNFQSTKLLPFKPLIWIVEKFVSSRMLIPDLNVKICDA